MAVNADLITGLIRKIAPEYYAEEIDNNGININLHNENVTGVLVCLDITEEIAKEAAEKNCNYVFAHHPLFFDPISVIDNKTHVGRVAELLIKNDISLYCAHTSTDAALYGLSGYLADIFGLKNRRTLEPTYKSSHCKIAVTAPKEDAQKIRDAFAKAGAGVLDNYSHCTYSMEGVGTFRPNDRANPHIGSANVTEMVEEVLVQALCAEEDVEKTVAAIKAAHPYEVPAIDVFLLMNPELEEAGIGIIGELEEKITAGRAVDMLKEAVGVPSVRFKGDLNGMIRTIAVCGGAGGYLTKTAELMGAELYITGEIKHNHYMESKINLCEAGHFDTEKCFCELFAPRLQKALNDVQCNVPVFITERLERMYINY